MKELQEIEDNVNELEKRGVELEMKLRSSEEGEIKKNTHTHTVLASLIRSEKRQI